MLAKGDRPPVWGFLSGITSALSDSLHECAPIQGRTGYSAEHAPHRRLNGVGRALLRLKSASSPWDTTRLRTVKWLQTWLYAISAKSSNASSGSSVMMSHVRARTLVTSSHSASRPSAIRQIGFHQGQEAAGWRTTAVLGGDAGGAPARERAKEEEPGLGRRPLRGPDAVRYDPTQGLGEVPTGERQAERTEHRQHRVCGQTPPGVPEGCVLTMRSACLHRCVLSTEGWRAAASRGGPFDKLTAVYIPPWLSCRGGAHSWDAQPLYSTATSPAAAGARSLRR